MDDPFVDFELIFCEEDCLDHDKDEGNCNPNLVALAKHK